MENASKALLMAAGVLIGIIILSWAVYLYTTYRSSADTVQKQIELGQIQDFNNKYLKYDGQTNLTIYDINTVINMANDNNHYYGLTEPQEDNYFISVYLGNSRIDNSSDFQTAIKGISNGNYMEMEPLNAQKGPTLVLKKYTAKVVINDNTSLVNKIIFTEN
ncbi:MAG: hypothetical protein IJH76_03580 [Clostridia bacterium]|nr:hypothetical protein [Clostridia bacterium]